MVKTREERRVRREQRGAGKPLTPRAARSGEGGAPLDPAAQARVDAINARLAELDVERTLKGKDAGKSDPA